MIVLGNSNLSMGLRLAGFKDSYHIKSKEQGSALLKELKKDEFIIANVSVIEMLPELEKFSNVVSIPDDTKAFDSIDDLKTIIRMAVGVDIEL